MLQSKKNFAFFVKVFALDLVPPANILRYFHSSKSVTSLSSKYHAIFVFSMPFGCSKFITSLLEQDSMRLIVLPHTRKLFIISRVLLFVCLPVSMSFVILIYFSLVRSCALLLHRGCSFFNFVFSSENIK